MCVRTGWLLAVDRTRTSQKKLAGAAGGGEIQRAARAPDDALQHEQRVAFVQSGGGFGGRVDDVRERPRGKVEGAHIARVQADRRMRGQMRYLAAKRFGVACEHQGLRFQAQPIVGPGKRLQQPAAEEARASGDEDPVAAKLLPHLRRVEEDVVEIGGQGVRHNTARLGFRGRTRRHRAD